MKLEKGYWGRECQKGGILEYRLCENTEAEYLGGGSLSRLVVKIMVELKGEKKVLNKMKHAWKSHMETHYLVSQVNVWELEFWLDGKMVLHLIATVVIKEIYPHAYTSNIFLANFPIMFLPSPKSSSQTISPWITYNHTVGHFAFKTKYIIIWVAQISSYCRFPLFGIFVFVPERGCNDTAIYF